MRVYYITWLNTLFPIVKIWISVILSTLTRSHPLTFTFTCLNEMVVFKLVLISDSRNNIFVNYFIKFHMVIYVISLKWYERARRHLRYLRKKNQFCIHEIYFYRCKLWESNLKCHLEIIDKVELPVDTITKILGGSWSILRIWYIQFAIVYELLLFWFLLV